MQQTLIKKYTNENTEKEVASIFAKRFISDVTSNGNVHQVLAYMKFHNEEILELMTNLKAEQVESIPLRTSKMLALHLATLITLQAVVRHIEDERADELDATINLIDANVNSYISMFNKYQRIEAYEEKVTKLAVYLIEELNKSPEDTPIMSKLTAGYEEIFGGAVKVKVKETEVSTDATILMSLWKSLEEDDGEHLVEERIKLSGYAYTPYEAVFYVANKYGVSLSNEKVRAYHEKYTHYQLMHKLLEEAIEKGTLEEVIMDLFYEVLDKYSEGVPFVPEGSNLSDVVASTAYHAIAKLVAKYGLVEGDELKELKLQLIKEKRGDDDARTVIETILKRGDR